MQFEHDIYVTFQGGSLVATELEWAQQLTRFVGLVLERLLGRKVRVSHNLENISKKIPDAACFIVIASQHSNQHSANEYVDALQQYLANHTNEQLRSNSRIFKVVKNYIPAPQQPAYIRHLLNYDFFQLANQDGSCIEFSASDTDTEQRYWAKLIELCYDVYNVLFALQNGEASAYGATIFLAETSFDQNENRDIIRRELQQYGHRVLPDKILSRNTAECTNQIKHSLEQACLSIHIFGENYGETMQASDISIVEVQNNVASEYADSYLNQTASNMNKHFSRIIWISPELKLVNEKQKLRLDELRHDPYALTGAEVVQTPLELLKTVIRQQIKQNTQVYDMSLIKDLRLTQHKKSVYVVHEKQSENKASEIIAFLESKGLKGIISEFDDRTQHPVELHRHKLNLCDAVLIYFETGNQQWLTSKFQDIIKSPGYGRKHDFSAIGIVTSQSELKGIERLQEPVVMNGSQRSFDNWLEPFLNKLNEHS